MVNQSISTKYIRPSNTKGARIKATASSGLSVTIGYPYDLSDEMAHFQAVKELVKKHALSWNISNMSCGTTKEGYVFCFTDSIVTQ